jgi:hypothetical protein
LGFSAVFPSDFFAAVRRVFAAGVFAAAADWARIGFAAGDLAGFFPVFLRVFLDIRLPFVAFGGSTIGISRVLRWQARIEPTLGKSDGLGVWLQGFDASPDCSLNALFGPDDG